MSSQKIKTISIQGFRGIKNQIVLPLSERSVLFYGDNGTGKSSIADAIEWFYHDDVEHLSSKEIDKTALRNISLTDVEAASVELTFTTSGLKAGKLLSFKRDKVTTELTNSSLEFQGYLGKSDKENLLLRYRNLEKFISGSKGEKLKYLSEIIGYREVTKIKDAIRKTFNSLKNDIRSSGFENQIAQQQKILLDQLGAVIYSESQLFEHLNQTIKPLDLGLTISSFKDIELFVEKVKKSSDTKVINELAFLQRCGDTLKNLSEGTKAICIEYIAYYDEFKILFDDVENIKQVLLLELLHTGKAVMARKIFDQDNCPLCLQSQDQQSLLKSIERRIAEISASSEKLKNYERVKESMRLMLDQWIKRLDLLLNEPQINSNEYVSIKSGIDLLKKKLASYQAEVSLKILAGKMTKINDDLKFVETDFLFDKDINDRNVLLKKQLPKDSSADVRVKIEFARSAFLSIQKLKCRTRGITEAKGFN